LSDVAHVFREEWGRAVSILIRALGDFELAEDAVQDAFATAVERWPREGTPRNPGAWIVATARNRAIDRIRRERTLARKREELVAALERLPAEDEEDEAPEAEQRGRASAHRHLQRIDSTERCVRKSANTITLAK